MVLNILKHSKYGHRILRGVRRFVRQDLQGGARREGHAVVGQEAWGEHLLDPAAGDFQRGLKLKAWWGRSPLLSWQIPLHADFMDPQGHGYIECCKHQ